MCQGTRWKVFFHFVHRDAQYLGIGCGEYPHRSSDGWICKPKISWFMFIGILCFFSSSQSEFCLLKRILTGPEWKQVSDCFLWCRVHDLNPNRCSSLFAYFLKHPAGTNECNKIDNFPDLFLWNFFPPLVLDVRARVCVSSPRTPPRIERDIDSAAA